MQTVLCKKQFFENRIFRFLGIYLALFGSSRRPAGRSCRQKATQNGRESEPESGQKSVPKLDPILRSSWTRFGAILGSKTGRCGGPFFQGFLEADFGSILAPSGTLLGPILAPCWPLLAPPGALLAPSWLHLGSFWALLAPSSRCLSPTLASSCAAVPSLHLVSLF